MDTSQEYIKMCDCKEVQRNAPTLVHGEMEYRHLKDDLELIWLPMQHQIQEMIYRLVCDYRVLQDFYCWCQMNRMKDETRYRIKGKSLEQLWLQFYMWREHEIVWSEEGKWEYEKTNVEKMTGVKPQFVLR